MVVTDHRSLEFFDKQDNLTPRQVRWSDFLSRYDKEIWYIKGRLNTVANCFSQYYAFMQEDPLGTEYVNMDRKLDPEGEDLMEDRVAEIRAMTLHDKSQRRTPK